MKITIFNHSPNPHDPQNPLNCKFQSLSTSQSSNFTAAGDQTLLLRRIKTSIPSPIITDRKSPAFSFSSSSSSPTHNSSPCVKSPWAEHQNHSNHTNSISPKFGLIGSLIREDGHIYSISASGNLLYTGSESKNIRVWKNMEEFAAFKSSSGLVKSIVVSGEKIFTGHQDGKVRIWKLQKKKEQYARIGNLPKSQDLIVKSMNPRNYVEVRRKRNVPWIKHYDAVSCLAIDEIHGILYSGSWDKSMKVWRISDSKCLESIQTHDDAVNSVAVTFAGMVFTGSADGTVKVWRRNLNNKVRKLLEYI